MSHQRCGECHHFEELERGSDEGMCLRFPPTASILLVPVQSIMQAQQALAPQNFTAFPSIRKDNRCGEFTPKSRIAIS